MIAETTMTVTEDVEEENINTQEATFEDVNRY